MAGRTGRTKGLGRWPKRKDAPFSGASDGFLVFTRPVNLYAAANFLLSRDTTGSKRPVLKNVLNLDGDTSTTLVDHRRVIIGNPATARASALLVR